jgi:hypothetical protein
LTACGITMMSIESGSINHFLRYVLRHVGRDRLY